MLDHISTNKPTSEIIAHFYNTPALLDAAGFQKLAYEDFFDIVKESLENIRDPSALLSFFQNEESSNSVVLYLRFIASAYLKLQPDEYLPFVLDSGCISIEDYCSKNVEAMGRESDQIHIIALTKAMRSCARVAYLDGTSQPLQSYEFTGEDDGTPPFDIWINLLYRPGHYDVLYR